MRIGGKGATVPNRLPSAAHGVAATGGRSLNDPSAPSVGGSEGPTTENADFSPSATGEVFEITMPKLGESVTEGTIGSWFKAVGDDIAFDDPLFDVSPTRWIPTIRARTTASLLDILVSAGETGAVGTVLARIGAAAHRSSRPVARQQTGRCLRVRLQSCADRRGNRLPAMAQADGLLSPLVRRLAGPRTSRTFHRVVGARTRRTADRRMRYRLRRP